MGQGCIRKQGAPEAAPAAVRQAVGGGCRPVGGGYCRLQRPLKPALGVRGTVAGHKLGALEEGGGGTSPHSNASLHTGEGHDNSSAAHSWGCSCFALLLSPTLFFKRTARRTNICSAPSTSIPLKCPISLRTRVPPAGCAQLDALTPRGTAPAHVPRGAAPTHTATQSPGPRPAAERWHTATPRGTPNPLNPTHLPPVAVPLPAPPPPNPLPQLQCPPPPPPAQNGHSTFRDFMVTRRVAEAADVVSFHLKPLDSAPVAPCLPGQCVPVRLRLPGHSAPSIRQYAVTATAGPTRLRLTIRAAAGPGPGSVSRYIVGTWREGAVVQLGPPGGAFVLGPPTNRPLVVLSAGLGAVGVQAIVDAALADNAPARRMWHFHGARNGSAHVFREPVVVHPALTSYVFYSRPREGEVEGVDYDAAVCRARRAGATGRWGRARPGAVASRVVRAVLRAVFCL